MQANGTVNPKGNVHVLANVKGDLVDFSGGDQVENVPAKVLEDTVK